MEKINFMPCQYACIESYREARDIVSGEKSFRCDCPIGRVHVVWEDNVVDNECISYDVLSACRMHCKYMKKAMELWT